MIVCRPSSPPPAPARQSAPSIVGRAMRDDFAVVSSHYNFAGFSAPRRNLHRWQRQMARDRVRTYGTELVLAGQTPQTAGWPGWRQIAVGPASVLSQKEALVNAAVCRLPRGIGMFAEVDADLQFDEADWIDRTIAMLQLHPCGQPFAEAVWTGHEGEVELVRASAAAAGFGTSPWLGHPGFSWAFRRDFFKAVDGWYDAAILGGADLLWSLSVLGGDIDPVAAAVRVGLGAEPDGYLAHHARVRECLGGHRPGHAEGRVWHEYHGSRSDRRYGQRPQIMEGLVPSRHLRHRADGVLEWTPKAPAEMRERVAGYFASRKEDA